MKDGPGAVVKYSPRVPRGPRFDSACLHCTLQGERLDSYTPPDVGASNTGSVLYCTPYYGIKAITNM